LDLPVVALILAAAFFSAAKHTFLGASAWIIAHCGWMPSQEYDRCPQIGQFLLFVAAMTGVGFFSLMVLSSFSQFNAADGAVGPAACVAGRGYSPFRSAANPACVSE
jgi:hypothetical protein